MGSVNAGVATIDAPAVTAPWGVLSADNLFITYAATSGTQAIVNQPTGWSTPEKTSEGGYGQGCGIRRDVLVVAALSLCHARPRFVDDERNRRCQS